MISRTLAALMVSLFILSSCAGLFVGYDAKQSFEKGLALFNAGKYEEALPLFQKAAELEPEYTRAHLYLGRSYLNLSRWIEAIPPLRTAYTLSPAETQKEIVNILLDALIGGAIAQVKKGNFTESLGYLKEAISLDPQSSKARSELVNTLINYGSSLLREGKASEAISTFSEAISLAPQNLDGYIGLAKAFLNNGNYLNAMKTVNEALKIAPDEADRSLLNELLYR